ncbi:hypothetical protein VTK73DRAFT_2931 [Phialemonium thermophilum]|uniref:Uncharacterized protein n=1 Tax=Phialemonium thermophilum TaxID=223376 RepID=A0ABR3VMJ8_9PEZI
MPGRDTLSRFLWLKWTRARSFVQEFCNDGLAVDSHRPRLRSSEGPQWLRYRIRELCPAAAPPSQTPAPAGNSCTLCELGPTKRTPSHFDLLAGSRQSKQKSRNQHRFLFCRVLRSWYTIRMGRHVMSQETLLVGGESERPGLGRGSEAPRCSCPKAASTGRMSSCVRLVALHCRQQP